MNVGDFFQNLSYGELANLSIGMDGAGSIEEAAQPRILHYTNQALTRLYSRFTHNRHYVNIQLSEEIATYRLQPQYAVSNADPNNNSPRYILDTPADPFPGNLIKIIDLVLPETAETKSENYAINELIRQPAVRMLSHDSFAVTGLVDGVVLRAECQLDHPRLSVPVDLAQEIQLAPILREALELRVAARVFSSMNGEAHVAKANLLDQEYERVCRMVEEKDLLQSTTTEDHDKLMTGGWNLGS